VPLALAAERGAVWVTSAGDPAGRLLKLDARSGRLLASSSVGARPDGVAVGFGSVWVANGPTETGNGGGPGQDTLWRIDRGSARAVAKIAVAQPHELAVAAGSVWVATDVPSLVRVDPRTNRVVGATRLRGGGPTSVASTGGAVWALTTVVRAGRPAAALLSRVDPATGRVTATRTLPGAVQELVADGDRLWLVGGGLRRADLATLRPVGPTVRARVGNGAAAGSLLWLTEGAGRVVRLDTRSGRLVRPALRVGRSADQVAAGVGLVWVTDSLDRTLVRITP
jgi:hypothetical protein